MTKIGLPYFPKMAGHYALAWFKGVMRNMFKKLKLVNDIIISVVCSILAILGGVILYFPSITENTVLSKLSDAFTFLSTGTLIDALLLCLLFSYGVVCFMLAITSFKLNNIGNKA